MGNALGERALAKISNFLNVRHCFSLTFHCLVLDFVTVFVTAFQLQKLTAGSMFDKIDVDGSGQLDGEADGLRPLILCVILCVMISIGAALLELAHDYHDRRMREWPLLACSP